MVELPFDMDADSTPTPDWLLACDPAGLYDFPSHAPGPAGALPVSPELLTAGASGDLFGWTQNVGMGLDPSALGRPEVLLLSTAGGLRAPDGRPIALGLHTGHFEIDKQVAAAARELTAAGAVPFAAACSDPCDGRTQGTPGMMDSLPYRNDAATVFCRLIRSLPTRAAVLGVATCDKGLPAVMMALAACDRLPVALVPGGVTLPADGAEDLGTVQSLGARFAQGQISLAEAAAQGCRACGTPGGGCQFLGTAATSQVVAEALGLTVAHAALAPSGFAIWLDVARRSARAVLRQRELGLGAADLVTDESLHNALVVHAAFGGSTNLLLHLPAIAWMAGRRRPTVADWLAVNRRTPRLVDVLPNGPRYHPTVRVFMAGGVPEVLLHLRQLGLLCLDVPTASGERLGERLDRWRDSERRRRLRRLLAERDGIDPDEVIFSPERAAAAGLTPTVAFPIGNLAPEGSVIKATAIDPSVVAANGVYSHRGPAKVFFSERAAIAAIKTGAIAAGDVMVIAGRGPLGSGMEETAQVTIALKNLPFGKHVALLTDGRFSGVSTGACVGHIGPEALAGGPLGKLADGDLIELAVDRVNLTGAVDLVGAGGQYRGAEWGAAELARRAPRPELAPDPGLPPETRLWAALQALGGGTWGGCVYDVEAITARLAGA
jgi:putative YjhG/YagF family dehydratase